MIRTVSPEGLPPVHVAVSGDELAQSLVASSKIFDIFNRFNMKAKSVQTCLDVTMSRLKLVGAARAAVVGFPTRVAESPKLSFLIFGAQLRQRSQPPSNFDMG